MNTISTFIYVT